MVLIDKVIADFPLSSQTQFQVIGHTFEVIQIEPELRFGDQDAEIPTVVEATISPKVDKAIESEEMFGKM